MRCLIIGCGCRGRLLAGSLAGLGYAVRGTTRNPASAPLIEAAGAEAVVADPDRVSTLIDSFEHVTAVCVLLGSATGSREQLSALHGTRLEMLLTKLTDTTVRGVLYEARGSVDRDLLDGGAQRVRAFGERSLATIELLDANPAEPAVWLSDTLEAVDRVVHPRANRPVSAQ